mgnify:CR=1 FL=1
MQQRHKIITLVDITETGVTDNNAKDPENQLRRNQQRNFDTLCQVISLRSNFYNSSSRSILTKGTLSDIPATCIHRDELIKVWSFVFDTDRTDPFGLNYELLKMDLNMVPIIPSLTETVPVFPPYFITSGDLQNTIIKNYLD